MKKVMLLLLSLFLIFTAACSGGGGAITTPVTTTALVEPATEFPEVVKLGSLIPEGFPTDDTYHEETDYPYLHVANDRITYCKTTGKYYLFAGDFLMRVDAETGDTIPVCAKEGCLHHKETNLLKKSECYAMCSSGAVLRSIQYFNGRLYVAHCSADNKDYVLKSICTDGTDCREELRLTNPGEFRLGETVTGHIGSTILHRGIVYYTWLRPVGDGRYALELWAYTLDAPGTNPQCIFRSSNSGFGTSSGRLLAYGTKLYLLEYYSAADAEIIKRKHSVTWETTGKAYMLDVLTGDWTDVKVPDGYDIRALQITDDGLLMSCQSLETLEQYYNEQRQEAASNADDEERPPSSGVIHTPGDYVRLRLTLDGRDPVQLDTIPTDKDFVSVYCDEVFLYDCVNETVYVYDMNGNLLGQHSFADLLNRDYEYNGEFYKVELDAVSCVLYPVGIGSTVLITWEFGRWGDILLSRRSFYLVDTSDTVNGTVELQELFSCDEYDYKKEITSGRWINENVQED